MCVCRIVSIWRIIMSSIKYGVYFYGSKHEEESLCYIDKRVFLSTSREIAEGYCKELQGMNPEATYKVCILVVDDT